VGIDRFQDLGWQRRGGMARIQQVRDRLSGETLALKTAINPSHDEAISHEFSILRQVRHAFLPTPRDLGRSGDGRMALTRSWVSGQAMQPGSVTTAAELGTLLGHLLAVLEQLHRHGWIHVDLKPEHLICTADGAMQLIDLGLCRRSGECATEIVGTVPYLAPEVIRGTEIDARTDLYAVGLLALHLLTGELPFAPQEAAAIARAKLEEAERIAERATTTMAEHLSGDAGDAWARWLRPLLALDPAQRPQSAWEARASLPVVPPAPPVLDATFVGRQEYLATFAHALDAARATGVGTTFIVQGAAGCGKTRLLQEAVFQAQASGHIASWCRLLPGMQSGRPLAWVGAPLQTGEQTPPAADPVDQLVATVEALGEAGNGLLLALEGSGDPAAEQIIAQCAAAVSGLPLVLITDGVSGSGSATAVAHAATTAENTTAQILPLEPLAPTAVEELIADQLPPLQGDHPQRTSICEIGAGNPRHLIALLTHPTQDYGDLESDFLLHLRRRIASLRSPEKDLLEFLALAPTHLPKTALAEAAGQPLDHVTSNLNRLREAGLVIDDGGGSLASCDRPRLILRRLGRHLRNRLERTTRQRRAAALAAALSGETRPDLVCARSRLHLLAGNRAQALADALDAGRDERARPEQRVRSLRRACKLVNDEEQQTISVETARQLGRAGRIKEGLRMLQHTPDAMSHPAAAAARVVQGALQLRAGDLSAAAKELQAAVDDPRLTASLRVEALFHLSRVRERQGERLAALGLAEHALELAQAHSPGSPQEREARNSYGSRLLAQGRMQQAEAVLTTALRSAQTAADRGAEAAAHNNLGLAAMASGEWRKAHHHFEQGLLLQEERGDPSKLATAWDNLGVAAHRLGDTRKAIAALERSRRYRLRVGDPKRLADSLNNLGALYHSLGESTRAQSLLQGALELRRHLGIPADVAATLNNLALTESARGDLEKAEALLHEAVSTRERIGDSPGAARARVNLAALHMRQGRYDPARRTLEEAEQAATDAPTLQLAVLEHRAEVELAGGSLERAGKHAAAAREHPAATGARGLPARLLSLDACLAGDSTIDPRRLLDQAAELIREHPIAGSQQAAFHRRAAEIQWRSGDLPTAIASIGKAMTLVQRGPDSIEEAACLRVSGEILRCRGRGQDAREQLEEAAERLRGLHAPTEYGRTLVALESTLKQLGDPAAAAKVRAHAVELLGADSHWLHAWPENARQTPTAAGEPTRPPREASSRGPDPIQMLRRVGEMLTRLGDPDALLADALTIVLETIGAERGQIALRDPLSGEIEVRVERNMDATTREDAVHHSRTILHRTLDSAAILFSEDAQQDADFRQLKSVVQFRIVSFICVPMLRQGRAIGTIYVDNRSVVNRFDRQAAAFIQVFASLAARALENAALTQRLQSENRILRREIRESWQLPNLIGHSTAMQRITDIVRRVAPTRSSVLLLGETGTGKEVLARAIHSESERADQPFVAVDCGALQPNLIESELFGHRRGAFSGAVQEKPGLFEAADGGTIFLDEIANLDLSLQARLLRVLQEGEVRRIGDNRSRHVDVRVICATNEDLHRAVADGSFRQDLFFRINIVPIVLPPLRERRGDIPLLTAHFLETLRKRTQHQIRGLAPEVTAALLAYEWPGNVRELENTLEGMVVLAMGENLSASDLPPWLLDPARQGGTTLQRSEKEILIAALEGADWVQTRAARELGISERVLRYKMKKHEIVNPRRLRRSAPPVPRHTSGPQ
jgi:Nif-specific regulatory protein